jgi:hypothetical protein
MKDQAPDVAAELVGAQVVPGSRRLEAVGRHQAHRIVGGQDVGQESGQDKGQQDEGAHDYRAIG